VTITISQLAATASLRTEVLAGHGGTDRIVNWAHVCELPEAWQWVGDRLGKAVKGIFQAPSPTNSVQVRRGRWAYRLERRAVVQ